VRDAYKVISRFPNVAPATWKFSGGKNDRGVWGGRGTVGKRREGRIKYLELVEGGGPDRTSCPVPPGMTGLESHNSWDVDVTWVVAGSPTRSEGGETDESALSVCGPSSTAPSPSDHCENDPALEGPGTAPSENGKERAVEGTGPIT